MAIKKTPPAASSGWRAYVIDLSDEARPLDAQAHLARSLGFNVLLAPLASSSDPAVRQPRAREVLSALAATAHAAGLKAETSLVLDRLAGDHGPPTEAFRATGASGDAVVDPRRPIVAQGELSLRNPRDTSLQAWWRDALSELSALGVDGFVQLDPASAGRALASALQGVRIRTLGGSSGAPSLIDARELDPPAFRAALAHAALCGGWAVSGLSDPAPVAELACAANRLQPALDGGFTGPIRDWTGPRAGLSVLSRQTPAGALVLFHNRSTGPAPWPPRSLPGLPWQSLEPLPGFIPSKDGLAAGEVVLCAALASLAAVSETRPAVEHAAAPSARIIIAGFSPSVDQGAYAAKAVIGDPVAITADIFADGHEKLAAAALTQADDETDWVSHPLIAEPNDVWSGQVSFSRLGRHQIKLQAWLDVWGGFVRDLGRKRDAGKDLSLDIIDARRLLNAAHDRASGASRQVIGDALVTLDGEPATPADLLLSPELATAMAEADSHPFLTESFVQPVEVEREAARFSSWYELFPRSQTDDPARHGTFADVIGRLPHIAAMGFDTLYFPPIHPIGSSNRKGRNNSLTAGPDDVGSPYAIGSAEGGHTAIQAELGTLEDFKALLDAAGKQGLEIALDFAIQCSPDHPWLKAHPGWFDWRPDGTIKYAENPPKTYEDIVNVDFYAEAAVPSLWEALRDAVLFWADQGVRAFRVDNPHTKPLPFWRWMIGEVKARYPEAIFLSEAFTRPKPMYHLAKAGFSQSYTYFTWRHTKAEFQHYLTELTKTPVRDFFRPHFFVNTPDINPYFLQSSGRAGFLIRAALAATLSGLFGVYAGFELCESAALPGREEYLDSEKYEIRPRPDRARGDIVNEITTLNRIRRQEPALQTHLNVEFHNAFNDQILYFSKTAPGRRDRLLVAISLDPHAVQEADFEVPLWLHGLQDWDQIEVEDLLGARRFRWTGKIQHMRLGPGRPYAIWRIGGEA